MELFQRYLMYFALAGLAACGLIWLGVLLNRYFERCRRFVRRYGILGALYEQVYSISSDGTASVEKFGFRLIRDRWSIMGSIEEVGSEEE